MSTQILNFKKVEISAESREAAVAEIENTLFHVNGDATQSFKNWKNKQAKAITERDIKEFMLDYLARKGKNCPGAGYMITLESAVGDTRERPYKIENIKGDGKREFKTFYKWIDKDTKQTVCQVNTNKADAFNAIKELYKDGKYKGTAELTKSKEVVKGNAVVAVATYTPSKNTRNGRWLAFGLENN